MGSTSIADSCKQSQRMREISQYQKTGRINSGPVSQWSRRQWWCIWSVEDEKWNSPTATHMNEASRYLTTQLGYYYCEENRGSGLIFPPRPIT